MAGREAGLQHRTLWPACPGLTRGASAPGPAPGHPAPTRRQSDPSYRAPGIGWASVAAPLSGRCRSTAGQRLNGSDPEDLRSLHRSHLKPQVRRVPMPRERLKRLNFPIYKSICECSCVSYIEGFSRFSRCRVGNTIADLEEHLRASGSDRRPSSRWPAAPVASVQAARSRWLRHVRPLEANARSVRAVVLGSDAQNHARLPLERESSFTEGAQRRAVRSLGSLSGARTLPAERLRSRPHAGDPLPNPAPRPQPAPSPQRQLPATRLPPPQRSHSLVFLRR